VYNHDVKRFLYIYVLECACWGNSLSCYSSINLYIYISQMLIRYVIMLCEGDRLSRKNLMENLRRQSTAPLDTSLIVWFVSIFSDYLRKDQPNCNLTMFGQSTICISISGDDSTNQNVNPDVYIAYNQHTLFQIWGWLLTRVSRRRRPHLR
jgi:hypothetical protein